MEIFHENFRVLLTRHGIKKPKAPFSILLRQSLMEKFSYYQKWPAILILICKMLGKVDYMPPNVINNNIKDVAKIVKYQMEQIPQRKLQVRQQITKLVCNF